MLVEYGAPVGLRYWWNGGSLSGLLLCVQCVTGLLLLLFYVPGVRLAFLRVDMLSREGFYGFLIRSCHVVGASFFFMRVYGHLLRGVLCGCYRMHEVWLSGCVLLVVLMVAAFLGYVLP